MLLNTPPYDLTKDNDCGKVPKYTAVSCLTNFTFRVDATPGDELSINITLPTGKVLRFQDVIVEPGGGAGFDINNYLGTGGTDIFNEHLGCVEVTAFSSNTALPVRFATADGWSESIFICFSPQVLSPPPLP